MSALHRTPGREDPPAEARTDGGPADLPGGAADGADGGFLPVFRPRLPPAEALLPYLRQIDGNRIYTNRGALVWQLERRLAGLLGQEPHAVRAAASGTLALELAILAHAGRATPDRPLALMPAFTFAATAQAAERCGYRPVFLDVDPDHWTLAPATVQADPRLARAGLVLAVAPYGRMPDIRGLAALQAGCGVPVAVDAAAGFEALLDAPGLISEAVPLALSFHATKGFSTAEGGAVVWACREGQARVIQIANFGFRNGREALTVGLNGKLSEYHAAVGLAGLDALDDSRRGWAGLARRYARAAEALAAAGRDIGGRLHLAPAVSPAYGLYEAASAAAAGTAEALLADRGIETRRWYARGVHRQPYFADRHDGPDAGAGGGRGDGADASGDAGAAPSPGRPAAGPPALPVTEDLCGQLLGLPVAADLDEAAILRVLAPLAALGRPGAAADPPPQETGR